MPYQDFDVKALAAYLHLTPDQVVRLAERDRVPGRKVAGEWKFSRAEIHHWLEERIGLQDEDELAKVEGVLQRQADAAGDQPLQISDRLAVEAIGVPLPARTKRSVVDSMIDLATATGQLWEPDKLRDAVLAREEMQPTALDNGAALLHPRRPMPGILGEPILALGVSPQGIPFGGARGALTDVFFLICSVDDRMHLQVLARISRLMAEADFLSNLRNAADAASARQVVIDYEANLLDGAN